MVPSDAICNGVLEFESHSAGESQNANWCILTVLETMFWEWELQRKI